jgi:hypothetical protein
MPIMKPKTAAAIMTAIFLTAQSSSYAQRTSVVYGQGTLPCKQWTTDREDLHLHVIEQAWVSGFITAVDSIAVMLQKANLRETDQTGIDKWISTYCESHPADSIADASGALAVELSK